MAIYIDTPAVYAAAGDKRAPRCFRGRSSCHLFSDLPGLGGSAELLAFARKIGMKPAWVQYPGTHREHFDLVGSRIEAARRAGAREISWREAAAIWARRRAVAVAAAEVGTLAAVSG